MHISIVYFYLSPGINIWLYVQLAASIHCESESAGLQRVCTTVNSDAFELYTDPDCEVRTPRAGTWEGGVIKGFLTGKSAGVKRPTFGKAGAQSGMSCFS